MEGVIIGRCTHNATTLSIPIFAHTTFLEVHNQVCNTFNDLAPGSFELTYALPGYSSCLLKSDMDVRVLHMSVSIEKRYYVDVLVNQKSYSDANVGQKSLTAPSTLAEGIINNDGNQYLGRYMAPEGKLYLSSAWKTFITHEGQQFEGGVQDFKLKLCMYAVETGFTFVYVKNDRLRVTAECWKKYAEGCKWRVHASVCSVNNYFYIRRLNNEHTCTRIREHKSAMLNSRLVASVLVEKIKSRPLIKPIDIVSDFKQDYGLNISYYNAWYGKEIAKTIVHGDDSVSYHQLFWYIDSVKKTNPGSHCVLEFDPDTLHFQRLFIAFGGCIEGFKYCRPMLFIDGTHVKNKFKGTLLAATGKNGNQGFFPLAFALVTAEDQANWTWFLKQLADILNPQERTITFVSDRQKGLLNSVSHVFPDSPHAYCLFHLKQNVLSKYPYALGQNFRNRIVQLLNECAYAATPELFELSLAKLKNTGGNPIREFLEDLPKENWSIAFFRGSRYGEMWSNVAESYNSWISKERLLPIYQLVDGIRVKLMEMNAERHHVADKWNSHLCPEMEDQMIKSIEVGRHWLVRRSTDFVLEVHTDDSSVMVDLESRFCSCHQWQANGFPCSHAFAAIMSNEELGPFDYIEDYFTADYYKKSYSFPIAPIPDIEKPPLSEDAEVMLKPPLTRKQPGRPRVRRCRSGGETRLIKCGRCKQMGHHNKRNCTAPI